MTPIIFCCAALSWVVDSISCGPLGGLNLFDSA
jgi:hypothetical protein